jgi:hypothetical protein
MLSTQSSDTFVYSTMFSISGSGRRVAIIGGWRSEVKLRRGTLSSTPRPIYPGHEGRRMRRRLGMVVVMLCRSAASRR